MPKTQTKSVLEIMKESLCNRYRTSSEINNYLEKHYPMKTNPRFPTKCIETINELLRKEKIFRKVSFNKKRNQYSWASIDFFNDNIKRKKKFKIERLSQLKTDSKEHILRKLLKRNAPFYTLTYESYNSRYVTSKNNSHIEFFNRHGYSVNNVHDFNRNLGDYLRLMLNKKDADLDHMLDDRINFPENFVWGNVDYQRYRFINFNLLDVKNRVYQINSNQIDNIDTNHY